MALPQITITEEQLKVALPPKLKKSINKELVDKLNATLTDPLIADTLRDNILGYTHVMQEGRFKIGDYLNAVSYVSFKLMGASNIQAYVKVFPDKYQEFLNRQVTDKDISSYVSSYNKGKLVNLIYEQTLVPVHVLNADLHQKALNVQADLMLTARSEKVRSDAANSLLTHLKPPETSKIEIDVKHTESSAVDELRQATLELVAQQRQSISAGQLTAKEVAHSKVIDGNCEDVT